MKVVPDCYRILQHVRLLQSVVTAIFKAVLDGFDLLEYPLL